MTGGCLADPRGCGVGGGWGEDCNYCTLVGYRRGNTVSDDAWVSYAEASITVT